MKATPTTHVCPEHGEYTDNGWNQDDCRQCERRYESGVSALREQHRRRHAFFSCGAGARYLECSLNNYDPTNKVQERSLQRIRAFASDIDQQVGAGYGFTLIGPPGTGKTHIIVSIARESIARTGWDARYIAWPELLASLRSMWASKQRDEAAKLIGSVKEASLLCLDELALRQVREGFESDLLLEILDYRYNAELSTIVASNVVDLDKLAEAIGERAADRLKDCNTLLLFPGESMRGKTRNRRLDPWPTPPDSFSAEVCTAGRMRTMTFNYVDRRRDL